MSAVVIAITNQKGGVGKTTTAVNLGAALAEIGRTVLLVDLDPQMNATSALGLYGAVDRGVYDALLDDVPAAELVRSTEAGVDLLPSSADLAGAEVELVPQMAREWRLQRCLEPLREKYDFTIIDCPPSLGLLTINALAAADEVVVPVQCEYLALEGLGQLKQSLDLVRRNLNRKLLLRGVLLTMYDARTNLAQQVAAEVRRHFPETFDAIIPRSVRLSEAPSYGKSIFSYDPGSRGAKAYRELAEELLRRMAGSVAPASAGIGQDRQGEAS